MQSELERLRQREDGGVQGRGRASAAESSAADACVRSREDGLRSDAVALRQENEALRRELKLSQSRSADQDTAVAGLVRPPPKRAPGCANACSVLPWPFKSTCITTGCLDDKQAE